MEWKAEDVRWNRCAEPADWEGPEKLLAETFAEGGSGFGADEVVSTSVIQQGVAGRYGKVLGDGT